MQILDLLSLGRLGPLPAALLAGAADGLLAPLRLARGWEGAAAAPERRPDAALAAGLERANRELGHPRAAELAAAFADPAVQVVVGGQQPGLLGGPLYSLSKAVAIVLAAERAAAAGRPWR